jgi:hypothetical protein
MKGPSSHAQQSAAGRLAHAGLLGTVVSLHLYALADGTLEVMLAQRLALRAVQT